MPVEQAAEDAEDVRGRSWSSKSPCVDGEIPPRQSIFKSPRTLVDHTLGANNLINFPQYYFMYTSRLLLEV